MKYFQRPTYWISMSIFFPFQFVCPSLLELSLMLRLLLLSPSLSLCLPSSTSLSVFSLSPSLCLSSLSSLSKWALGDPFWSQFNQRVKYSVGVAGVFVTQAGSRSEVDPQGLFWLSLKTETLSCSQSVLSSYSPALHVVWLFVFSVSHLRGIGALENTVDERCFAQAANHLKFKIDTKTKDFLLRLFT